MQNMSMTDSGMQCCFCQCYMSQNHSIPKQNAVITPLLLILNDFCFSCTPLDVVSHIIQEIMSYCFEDHPSLDANVSTLVPALLKQDFLKKAPSKRLEYHLIQPALCLSACDDLLIILPGQDLAQTSPFPTPQGPNLKRATRWNYL